MSELALLSRFVLAILFIFAGAAKIARRAEFAEAVRDYRLLPVRASELVSRTLPPGEFLVGALLLLGLEPVPVAAAVGFCLLTFSAAIALNLLRGRRIDCGCFGLVADSRLSWSLLGRNALLLSAALLVAIRPVSMPLSSEVAWLVVASVAVVAAGLVRSTRRYESLTRHEYGGPQ